MQRYHTLTHVTRHVTTLPLLTQPPPLILWRLEPLLIVSFLRRLITGTSSLGGWLQGHQKSRQKSRQKAAILCRHLLPVHVLSDGLFQRLQTRGMDSHPVTCPSHGLCRAHHRSHVTPLHLSDSSPAHSYSPPAHSYSTTLRLLQYYVKSIVHF